MPLVRPGVADGRWGGRHAAPRRGASLVATCVGKTESTLTALPGVSSARFNLLAGRAALTVTDAGLVKRTALAAALDRVGYTATVTARGDAAAGGGAADVEVLRIATPAAAAEVVGLLRRMDGVAAAQALVGGVPADEDGSARGGPTGGYGRCCGCFRRRCCRQRAPSRTLFKVVAARLPLRPPRPTRRAADAVAATAVDARRGGGGGTHSGNKEQAEADSRSARPRRRMRLRPPPPSPPPPLSLTTPHVPPTPPPLRLL